MWTEWKKMVFNVTYEIVILANTLWKYDEYTCSTIVGLFKVFGVATMFGWVLTQMYCWRVLLTINYMTSLLKEANQRRSPISFGCVMWCVWSTRNSILFRVSVVNYVLNQIKCIPWVWFISNTGRHLNFFVSGKWINPLICLQYV